MKIVFFGTPDFSVPCLRRLASEHEVLAVVTQPDRARDRGKVSFSPVKQAALDLGLRVLQPEKIRAELSLVTAFSADIGVTAAYGQILPQALLDAFPRGIVNVHASLLPAYRGSSPIQWAIANGERETGITIMQTALGVDCGDILGVLKTPIGDDETAGELFDRLAALAPDILSATLDGLEKGSIVPVPQDERRATHFPMLTKETGRIDWSLTAEEIRNRVRGFDPWPGAYAVLGSTNLKIKSCSCVVESGEAGRVLRSNPAEGLVVACGKNALRIETLQAAGGKPMSAKDYLRGHAIPVGTTLC